MSISFKEVARRLKLNVIERVGLSNRVIEGFCKLACGEIFKGVYACDRIPLNIAKEDKFIIVVNLGKRSAELNNNGQLPVGHFVAIIANMKSVHYIDPFGFPPYQLEIKSFLNLCQRKVKVSQKQIQHLESNYCGIYCIIFACYAAGHGNGMKLRFYRTDMLRNDTLCIVYLKRMFSSCYSTDYHHQKSRFPFL